ncbi:GAF domain-containing protein [Candidatus Chloroploca mongolica]|uniref:GAF domain-containing protein n=1 Tax=Candidatus Chloroploca mongolica TaxID=2528176 RepID=UPI0020B3F404|nr:GAF domain-containing protein [Candidatus Chloroploca mongolica]
MEIVKIPRKNLVEPAHIFVIDDDVPVRRIYADMLINDGYRVSTAGSGEEALAYLQLITPDLILLELGLAGFDSLGFTRQMKADQTKPFIPIMIMSSHDDVTYSVASLDAGADDFLVKPIPMDGLLARVRAMLRLQRAQRQLQHAQRKTELLLHLTRDLGASIDLDVLMTGFLDHLADSLGAIRASIILAEFEDHQPVCYSSSRNPSTLVLNDLLRQGLAGWVLRERNPAIIQDARNDSRWVTTNTYHSNVRAVAAIPLIREGQALGVITLVHHTPGFFTEEHVELLTSLAAQSAVALESARLFRLTQRQKELLTRRAEELRKVNEINAYLSELMAPEQITRLLVHMIQQQFGYPLVCLMMREGDELVVHAAAGPMIQHSHLSSRFAIHRGLYQQVFATHQPICVTDVTQEASFEPLLPDDAKVRAQLIVPIILRREVLGVLDVSSPEPGVLGASDEAVLSAIMYQYSIALGNARLYRAVEDERSTLNAVLRSATDPILLIGPGEDLLLANRAAEEHFGLPLQEHYGKPMHALIKQGNGVLAHLLSLVEASMEHTSSVTEMTLPGDVSYSVSIAPVASGEHVSLGKVLVLRDITPIKRLERQERDRVRGVFRRYVSPQVAEQLLTAGGSFGQPTECQVAVIFADIRGFTTITERTEPQVLIEKILNRYFTAMTEVLYAYDGTIDKFLGDGIIGVFGSPIAHPDDPQRALSAAVAMQHAFTMLAAEWKAELDYTIGMGIGVSFGRAIVGNIGSEQRQDYTLIGDVVNTASRLSGIADPGQVIVSHHLADVLAENWLSPWKLIPRGPIHLKGKEQPHQVFEVGLL